MMKEEKNLISFWFFVFCLVIIFYLFFSCFSCSSRFTRKRRAKFFPSTDGLDDWYWIPFINFSLWKFMWPVNWMVFVSLVRNKRERTKASESRSSLMVDELYRNARENVETRLVAFGLLNILEMMLVSRLVKIDYDHVCNVAEARDHSANFQLLFSLIHSLQVGVFCLWWQLEFKRRSSSCRITSTPCNGILRLRNIS